MANIKEQLTKIYSWLPGWIPRWFPVLGNTLEGGTAPSWWPVGFFAAGLCLGGFHIGYDTVVMKSILLFSGVVAVSLFRIQWGACLFIGLVAGDFLLFRLTHIAHMNQGYYRNGFRKVTEMAGFGLSSLIYYYLMAVVCYRVPLLCRDMGRQSQTSPIIQGLVNVLSSAVLVYFWTLAYPVLIRPMWTWIREVPPASAIMPVQQYGGWIVLVAIAAGVAREWVGRRTGTGKGAVIEHVRTASHMASRKARIAMQAIFGTFILSGLLTTWWDTLIVSGVLVLFSALRAGYCFRFPRFWIRLTRAAPIWARLLSGLAISWYLAEKIHEELWSVGGGAMFLPLIVSFAVSLLVMLLLFCPDKAPRGAGA